MSSLATRLHVPVPHRGPSGRPTSAHLLRDQLVHCVRDLWRSRIAFIFTFLFPLIFLLVIGALVGNGTISPDSTVPVMQFVTPSAALMGALFGSYPTIAYSLADARERGVVRRVRGTPLPLSLYLAGRIGAAVLFALGSLTVVLVVGVLAYDVEVQWRTMPATVVTVAAAVASFSAVGVAVAGLTRSANVAQAVSTATAVLLSMLSGLMGVGDLPAWADRVAEVFPVKPVNDALHEQFDPTATGSGWDLAALAVVTVWAVAGVVVATLTLRADPAPSGSGGGGQALDAAEDVSAQPTAGRRAADVRATAVGRPSLLSLLRDQARWATQSALRDTGWVFFAIAFPLAQYVFTAAVAGEAFADSDISPPLGLQSATGMIAWGAMVTAMVFVPDAVARARDHGVLKRLRGTPLDIGSYVAGRLASAFLLVLGTAVLVLASGIVWFELDIAWAGVPVALGLLVLGTATLGACGMLLVSLLPSDRAVTAVGLGIAIPLAFFSDVFAVAVVPEWMSTVGSFFPLKHLANALSHALDPGGSDVGWVGVAVMVAWLVGASLLAVRRFRWSPG